MFKKLIILFITLNVLFADQLSKEAQRDITQKVKEFYHLPLEAQKNIFWAYTKGKKYDLSYSLAAIIWQESVGGLYPINLFDKPYGSCGRFHNNIKTVIQDHPEWGFYKNKKLTKYQINKICSKLILNPDFSLQSAVKILNFYRHKYHGNWKRIWASYNGGNNIRYNTAAQNYSYKIYIKVQALSRIVDGGDWDNRSEY